MSDKPVNDKVDEVKRLLERERANLAILKGLNVSARGQESAFLRKQIRDAEKRIKKYEAWIEEELLK